MKKKVKPLSHAPRKREKAANPEVVTVDGEGNTILYDVMRGSQLRGLFISDCCRGFYVYNTIFGDEKPTAKM